MLLLIWSLKQTWSEVVVRYFSEALRKFRYELAIKFWLKSRISVLVLVSEHYQKLLI